jgi:DNA-binding MarR family transcriptional regulator
VGRPRRDIVTRVNESPEDEYVEDPGSLAEVMVQLGARASVELAERPERIGLTPAMLRALRMIEQRPRLSQRALAWRLGIAASRVTKLVDELEDQGSVERPRRGTDRRRSELQLTGPGALRLFAAREALRELDEELCRTLADEEIRPALVLFGKLASATNSNPARRSPT